MKKWKRAVTGILAVSVLTAGLALPGIAGAAATDQTETSKTQFKNGAVIPVSQSEASPAAKSWLKLFHCWKDWLLPKPVWTPESTIFTVWTKR